MKFSEYKEKAYAKDPELKELVAEELRQMKIGEELRAARKQAKLTQAQVAEKMHVSRSQVSQLEGHPQNITLSTLLRYARAVGLHADIALHA